MCHTKNAFSETDYRMKIEDSPIRILDSLECQRGKTHRHSDRQVRSFERLFWFATLLITVNHASRFIYTSRYNVYVSLEPFGMSSN